jgi:hypothetical protein
VYSLYGVCVCVRARAINITTYFKIALVFINDVHNVFDDVQW